MKPKSMKHVLSVLNNLGIKKSDEETFDELYYFILSFSNNMLYNWLITFLQRLLLK